MTNKENLIFALETFEDEGKEVEFFSYSSSGCFSIDIHMKPEIMVRGNEIEICDGEFGTRSIFRVMLDDTVEYYDNGDNEEYVISRPDGAFHIYFCK